MLKKEFRNIELSNGEKKLTVVFQDERYELLSTLFFVDVRAFGDWIRQNINDVLQGKACCREISCNVCGLMIKKENTVVYDILAEDGVGKQCSLPTSELSALIDE